MTPPLAASLMRNIRRLVGLARLFSATLVISLAAGCGQPAAAPDHVSIKPLHRILDASQIKLLDIKLRSGRLRLEQSASPEALIEGEVRVHSGDQEASRLHASGLDLQIKEGRFTRVELPEPGPGFSHDVILTVRIPTTMNLNVTLGSGRIEGEIALPLRTDLQVGAGEIDLVAPTSSSAKINAQVNVGLSDPAIVIDGFDKVMGAPDRQLTRWSYENWIGLPSAIGALMEVRINEGAFHLNAAEESAPENPADGASAKQVSGSTE